MSSHAHDLSAFSHSHNFAAAYLHVLADALISLLPLGALAYRERLAALPALCHVTVEVNRCPGAVLPA